MRIVSHCVLHYPATHVVSLDIVVKRRRVCEEKNCTTTPSYGVPGARSRRWCAAHGKLRGALPVISISKCCEHPGCSLRSSYGVPGTRRARWCSTHGKLRGGISVLNGYPRRECEVESCTTFPSHGVPGTRRRRWCAAHSSRFGGTAIVSASNVCEEEGCVKRANYCVDGERRRWCAGHSKHHPGSYQKRKLCEEADCAILPTYGVPGTRSRRWCAAHGRLRGGVSLKKRVAVHGKGPI